MQLLLKDCFNSFALIVLLFADLIYAVILVMCCVVMLLCVDFLLLLKFMCVHVNLLHIMSVLLGKTANANYYRLIRAS